MTVMLLMGWTLRPDRIVDAIRRPLPSFIAIFVNTVVIPLLCWPALWLLPPGMAGGLIVASLVPCTLASASVWTRAANGDDAIAMITTVVTNLACFLVAPFGLSLLLARQVQLDVSSQMAGLFFQVVLPLVLGQSLRHIGLSSWADRYQKRLAIVCQLGILTMVLFGAVISAEMLDPSDPQASSGLTAVAIFAVFVHLAAVAIGYFGAGATGCSREQKIGVAIAGGQKTLMVGLQLALDCGVSVLPMVLYHVGQLIIDTYLVRFWTRKSVIEPQNSVGSV